MGTVTSGLFRWLRGGASPAAPVVSDNSSSNSTQLVRHSTGLGEIMKVISAKEGLSILDLGATSPQNIMKLTEMGHRVASEDLLLASIDPTVVGKDEKGKPVCDVERFLAQNLKYDDAQFDAVLCWDVPDYLPEPLVKPAIERLGMALKPGGSLLAFFHTEGSGMETAYYRFHIAGADQLDMKRGPHYPLQRIFHNRHIEKLFKDYHGLRFFLARDQVREVMVKR